MSQKNHIPTFAYNYIECPFCKSQDAPDWFLLCNDRQRMININNSYVYASQCPKCAKCCLWHRERMVYPDKKIALPLDQKLSDEIKKCFRQAKQLLQESQPDNDKFGEAVTSMWVAAGNLCIEKGSKKYDLSKEVVMSLEVEDTQTQKLAAEVYEHNFCGKDTNGKTVHLNLYANAEMVFGLIKQITTKADK